MPCIVSMELFMVNNYVLKISEICSQISLTRTQTWGFYQAWSVLNDYVDH